MAGKGWTWTWQRCGRYKYQKVLVHSTNADRGTLVKYFEVGQAERLSEKRLQRPSKLASDISPCDILAIPCSA